MLIIAHAYLLTLPWCLWLSFGLFDPVVSCYLSLLNTWSDCVCVFDKDSLYVLRCVCPCGVCACVCLHCGSACVNTNWTVFAGSVRSWSWVRLQCWKLPFPQSHQPSVSHLLRSWFRESDGMLTTALTHNIIDSVNPKVHSPAASAVLLLWNLTLSSRLHLYSLLSNTNICC